MSGWQRSCGRSDWHISHTYWTAHVMGDEAWECPGRMEHTDACDAWADTTARCTCGLDPEPAELRSGERQMCARHAASHGPHASELPCYWCSVEATADSQRAGAAMREVREGQVWADNDSRALPRRDRSNDRSRERNAS